MDIKEIPDKKKIFVGVLIDSDGVKYGFVNLYGKLIHAETQTIKKEQGNEAGFLIGSIRGIRGELNLRFKNFVGICICFKDKENKIESFGEQLNQNLNIPVYVEDYSYLQQLGENWVKSLGDKLENQSRMSAQDVTVIYGAAKFVIKNSI